MSNQAPETPNTSSAFANRLKSARESQGMERKDVAARLRLNEKVIIMMEKDTYPDDLPITFVRGYLRAYSRLLQIPNNEITQALELIQPVNASASAPATVVASVPPTPTASNFVMQVFTYLIIFTIAGLVLMGWYNHVVNTTVTVAENKTSETDANVESFNPSVNLPTTIASNKNPLNPVGDHANETIISANNIDDDID